MTTLKERPPRPFLKWPGGKRQLLAELLDAVAAAGPFRRYHEPFLGGGALFYALAAAGQLQSRSFLSDINPNLIDAYLGVRDDVDRVIAHLEEHKRRHSETHYYKVRARTPRKLAQRAARVIYLNRTCYNGLYRENSKGEFNTPFGRYKNPNICDERNLRAVSAILQSVDLGARSFDCVLEQAEPGDLVYFDPPYNPVSRTAYFTSYARDGFGPEAQQRLADTAATLSERGVKVILSNSMTDSTRALYQGFAIREVLANRPINSRPDRRGKIAEALIANFPLPGKQAAGPRGKNAVRRGREEPVSATPLADRREKATRASS